MQKLELWDIYKYAACSLRSAVWNSNKVYFNAKRFAGKQIITKSFDTITRIKNSALKLSRNT